MPAEATRSRIKNAALRLFVAKGVKETTTRELARSARIAEGTIYRHYDSKDALVRDLFEGHFSQFTEELDRVQSAQKGGVREKLQAMIEYMCNLYDSNETLYRFLLTVQYEALPSLVSRERSPLQVVGRVVAEAIERNEIPDQNVRLTAAMVLGTVMQSAQALMYGSLRGRMAKFALEISAACERIVHAR
jgi:AcrR family transcriptional regulator